MLPDLDHFLPLWNGASLFHNTLALGVVPLALIIISGTVETHRYEDSSKYQRFFICVAVVLVAHLLLDLLGGSGIYVGFPTSTEAFTVGATPLLKYTENGILLMTSDLLWLAMMILVISGNIIQKRIYALFEGFSEMSDVQNDILHFPSKDVFTTRKKLTIPG